MNNQDQLHTIAEVIEKLEAINEYEILCQVIDKKTINSEYFQARFNLSDEKNTKGIRELSCHFHNKETGEYIKSILINTTDDLLLVDEIITEMDIDSLDTPEKIFNYPIKF